MDYGETVAELERFAGKAVWLGVFATEGGERFPVLTVVGKFQRIGQVDSVIARAHRELGVSDAATFILDEPRLQLNVWADLLLSAKWVEVADIQRLRLELHDGTGIDVAELAEEEAQLFGLP
jgi:hypothetical protein